MYYKLENDELEKIQRVAKITFTDYELQGDFIPVENLMAAIEDLLIEIDNLEEKNKDLEEEMKEEYEPKSRDLYSYYGLNEREFV